MKRPWGSHDMQAAKRRGLVSPTDGLRLRSTPLTCLPSLVPSPRSLSTPKSSPRNRLLMDCVEVVPFHELLRRREGDAERDDMGNQRRSDLDDHAWQVTPETPSVPRIARDLLERDEIGTPLTLIQRCKSTGLFAHAVPETPDAVPRLPPMSFPRIKSQVGNFHSFIDNIILNLRPLQYFAVSRSGSPSRQCGKSRPLCNIERPVTALNEVGHVFSRPGLS
jgi:hypothetical protein